MRTTLREHRVSVRVKRSLWPLIWMVTTPFVGYPVQVTAQVRLERVDESVRLINPGPGDLVNLRIGSIELARLNAGQSRTVDAAEGAVVQGRFSLDSWSDALGDVTEPWAEFHLRTAGFYLDVLQPGPEGDPRGAANIADLIHLSTDLLDAWSARSSIAQRLLARTARHASPGYVTRLMSLVGPSDGHETLTGPYQELESISASVRQAIEAHGRSTMVRNSVRHHLEWARDRGLEDVRLLDILDGKEPNLSATGEVNIPALQAAADVPDRTVFHRLLVSAALLEPDGTETSDTIVRMACAELDRLAGRMAQTGRWIATEAYLRLVIRSCGDTPAVRDRIGEYYRRRAEDCTERQDLVGAVDWMSAAYWVSQNQTEKQFLAESLAELSILRFRAKDAENGRDFLARARALDPLNERVLEAGEYEPDVDPRARIGVGIVIVLLAFFAFRRLRKLWSRQEPTL